MNDTVKLIIEIPKAPKNDHERWVLAHGTPLDDVKAEIEQCKEKGISEFKVCYWDYVRAIDTVLSIIDNIGKGVSE